METWVRSLGWEDPLEKEWLPTSIFWPGEFQLKSMGSDMTVTLTKQMFLGFSDGQTV